MERTTNYLVQMDLRYSIDCFLAPRTIDASTGAKVFSTFIAINVVHYYSNENGIPLACC